MNVLNLDTICDESEDTYDSMVGPFPKRTSTVAQSHTVEFQNYLRFDLQSVDPWALL